MQPKSEDYDYDLDRALSAVVGVRTTIPSDAFTAETLGTERSGHGVLIRRDGLVLTIGYLVTEAETVWLTLAGGKVVPGHVLGYDQETGFGLVQALARIDVPVLDLGSSARTKVGDHVVVAGAGGRQNAVAARIVAKQEFAGYWEYLLDEALFTAPSHPNWGGTGLINPAGELIGIGSLQVQHGGGEKEAPVDINMIVPIDLLKPILDDLTTIGQTQKSPRPWLGIFAAVVHWPIQEKPAITMRSPGCRGVDRPANRACGSATLSSQSRGRTCAVCRHSSATSGRSAPLARRSR